MMFAGLDRRGNSSAEGEERDVRWNASGLAPQELMEQVLFGYSSPPEAQGEYVMYSPEIYRATAKCVLKEPSMSTLCYRLNLVVSLGDVASGKHCVSQCYL